MIIRIKKRENPYAQIDKRPLHDKRLTFKARGILAYLLTKPDDWDVRVSDLIENSPEGREAVQAGLRELKRMGYAVLETTRDNKGRVSGKTWVIMEEPTDGFSVNRENRQTENPSNTNNDKETNNDNTAASVPDAAYAFEQFWNDYGYKKGSKAKAHAKFRKLTGRDLEALREALPHYIRATVTKDAGDRKNGFKPMRRYPEFFLSGRVWESLSDEIQETRQREAAAPADPDYQKYLDWVKAKYPNLLSTAKHMSRTEYTTYRGGYTGKATIGPNLERDYMIRAHEQMNRDETTLHKYDDVFALHIERVQEFVKLHTV